MGRVQQQWKSTGVRTLTLNKYPKETQRPLEV